MPSSSRPPYPAYLRVFEPLDAVPAPERARWAERARRPVDREAVAAGEHVDAVRRLTGVPPRPLPREESEDVLVLHDGNRLLLCPVQTRLRSWTALEQLHEDVPAAAVEAVVPAALREQAAADRERWLRSGADPRVFTRTATWEVPLAWFVLFGEAGRELSLSPRSLRYRSPMSAARRRAARALRTMRQALDDAPVTGEVEQLGRWLEDFHPHAVVELDYGGLVDLLDDAALRGDDSADDVSAGLAALAEGDATSAAAAYKRFTTRWDRVRMAARAS